MPPQDDILGLGKVSLCGVYLKAVPVGAGAVFVIDIWYDKIIKEIR